MASWSVTSDAETDTADRSNSEFTGDVTRGRVRHVVLPPPEIPYLASVVPDAQSRACSVAIADMEHVNAIDQRATRRKEIQNGNSGTRNTASTMGWRGREQR